MISEHTAGQWTVRVFPDVNNWFKIIAVRGEGRARQVINKGKLTLAEAEGYEPTWQS